MKIQQIRNATLKIDFADQTILIDPWLQDQGTGFSARAVKPEMQDVKSPLNALPESPKSILAGVDFALVTHIHPDHFTPDYLPKDLKLVFQNEEDANTAKAMGFEQVLFFEGDRLKIGDITIKKVKAVHGDNEPTIEKMGEGSGYILSSPKEPQTLYIAGDSIYTSEMEKILQENKPDVITVNACEATMPAGRLIMNLDDLVSVCKAAPEAAVIATHLDSVNHALLTSQDVKDFVKENQLDQVLVPANGESLIL